MTPIPLISTPPAQRDTALSWKLVLLLIALLGFRLWYAGFRQLVPDEAFYWTWTRHLAGGYFDHPPMIAWLMWLSTRLLGDNEFGVRFFAVLMSFGALAIFLRITARLLADARATAFVAALLLTSPMFLLVATIFTPDSPAIFFSACALACAVDVGDERRNPRLDPARWLAFGAFCGLALLSKYTTILLPAAIFWALLTTPHGRAHLRRPWIYLAAALALAVFSPTIYWNYTHDFASFRWQLGHGLSSGDGAEASGKRGGLLQHVLNAGKFIAGQAGLWTPVLFVLGVAVLIHYWRRYRRIDLRLAMLLWTATLTIVFFGYAFAKSGRGEINWTDFAYWPLALLTAAYLTENWTGQRVRIAQIGCALALAITLTLHVPELLARFGVPKMDEPFGWRELGNQLSDLPAGVPIFTTRHQDAGEAAFYMRGHPDVWCTRLEGARPTSFDYYPNQPNIEALPEMLLMAYPPKVKLFCQRYGFVQSWQKTFTVNLFKHQRSRTVTMLVRENPPARPPSNGEDQAGMSHP
ncbi:MAG TPA: glycosyltransferase family 39 protein [Tepidisphaeraceae bacterium]|jgi:hypothetical protein